MLRDWKVQYESSARSHTIVPDNFRQFMRQQLRWKRSWTRESLIAGSFMWRKHPLAAMSAYVGMVLPVVAPSWRSTRLSCCLRPAVERRCCTS